MNYDKKFILDSIKTLGRKYGNHEAFRDVVTCCAYSFANAVDFKKEREDEYLRIINKYSDDEQKLFPTPPLPLAIDINFDIISPLIIYKYKLLYYHLLYLYNVI